MSLPLLLWCGAAILLAPAFAAEYGRGRAVARVIITGFALGALSVGVGTLTGSRLTAYASASQDNGLFVSITVGLLVGALGPWPWPLSWRSWIWGLPLLIALAATVSSQLRFAPLGLGVMLGALPLFAGTVIPGDTLIREEGLTGAAPGWWLIITAAIALAEPLVLIVLLPVPWLLPGLRPGWPASPWWRRVMPMLGLILLIGLTWLALTVAGTPWVHLSNYIDVAPLSVSAERLLAVLAIGALIALGAPWPLRRLAPVLVPMPAIVILAWRMTTDLAPSGIAAWLPAALILLVTSALLAFLFGHLRTALGTIGLAGALLGSPIAFWAGLLLAGLAVLPSLRPMVTEVQADPIRFFGSPWFAALVAAALTVVIVAMLEVEVVMATVLAAGSAALLSRPAHPNQALPRPSDII